MVARGVTMKHLAGAAFLVVMTGACVGSESNSGASSDAFVGTWQCTVTDTLTQTQPTSGVTTTDDLWMAVITDDGNGNLTEQRTWEDDSGIAPCTEHFTLSRDGHSFTLVGTQTCPTTTPTLTNTLNQVNGTLDTSGTTFTVDGSYTLSGTAGGQPFDATGMSTGTCTKM
jgi:hypothetical protein